jgi:DNA-binding CsgD family transcriptional regulator
VDILEAFGALLRKVYRLATTSQPRTFRKEVLAEVADFLAFDSAMWGQALGMDVIPFNVYLYNQPEEMLSSWLDVSHLDPYVKYLKNIPFGTTVDFSSLMPREDLTKHPIYLDHARDYGKEYTLVTVHADKLTGTNSFISLYRADPLLPFTEEERKLKQTLFPHLIAAYQLNLREHLYMQEGPNVPGNTYSHAICDRNGVLHFCGEDFFLLIAKQWPEWHQSTLPDEIKNLFVQKTAAGFHEYVGSELVGYVHPHGELFRIDVRAVNAVDRLPRRQRSIAQLLANGLTYKEIAGHLNISPSTVTNQANAIYERLGVRGKVEIACMLM